MLSRPALARADLKDEADLFVARTNEQRQAVGVLPLRSVDDLSGVALQHSIEMAQNNSMYHNHALTSQVSGWSELGENVGQTAAERPDRVEELVRALYASPPHREHILHPAFSEVGIGVASNATTYYVTEVFRTPPPQPAPSPPPRVVRRAAPRPKPAPRLKPRSAATTIPAPLAPDATTQVLLATPLFTLPPPSSTQPTAGSGAPTSAPATVVRLAAAPTGTAAPPGAVGAELPLLAVLAVAIGVGGEVMRRRAKGSPALDRPPANDTPADVEPDGE